jgi:hypothetical protein
MGNGKRCWFLLGCVIFLWGCAPAIRCQDVGTGTPCIRVLFIGNSYTYVNDLPNAFAQLASAGGHLVETGMQAQGGWSLADHEKDPASINAINTASWNFVVLQEQSEAPAVPQWRTSQMDPAARALVQQIKQKGSVPLFFMTWAHRDGLPSAGLQDFASMQFQIEDGYLQIANALDVAVAPVGYAWWQLRIKNPDIDLWQSDGSHPNEKGTYLAACVFYAAIFRESPEGLGFPFPMSDADAKVIQSVAAQVVLTQPAQWHLKENNPTNP